MSRRKLKYYAYRLAPRPAAFVHRILLGWASRRSPGVEVAESGPVQSADEQARELAERAAGVPDLETAADLVFGYPLVNPNQNRQEILALMRILAEAPPRTLCEIGSAAGGTLFLLARIADPEARLLSLDVNNTPDRAARFRHLVRSEQSLSCLEGDSHDRELFARFREWLGEDKLDFLLIDGDHTLEGVEADYRMYSPFVRPGGIVVFHDICPDFKTRYGIDTGTYAGGVPEFWARLKPQSVRVLELVDHRLQDGRGIGVLRVPDERERQR